MVEMNLLGKTFLVIVLVAAAQAVEWANVKPRTLQVPRLGRQQFNSRIVGGTIAERHQFPHQVGLFMDSIYFCGGSLISDTIVLTAAHCADGTGQFEIHLGAQNIDRPGEEDHIVEYSRSYVVHAAWNSNTINNDIAFVRMRDPVNGTGIAPIRLPSRTQEQDSFAGYTATISGWGWVADDTPGLSSQLNFANVTVITNSECFNIFGSTINENKICVDTSAGSGTCFGDSGGPLAFYETDGMPTIIGITSFVANDGCEAGFPAGFTRVTVYLDWLEFNTGIPIRP